MSGSLHAIFLTVLTVLTPRKETAIQSWLDGRLMQRPAGGGACMPPFFSRSPPAA